MTATLNASNDDERPVPAIVAVLVDGFVPVYGLEAVSTSCTAPEAVEASVPIFHVTVPLVFEPPRGLTGGRGGGGGGGPSPRGGRGGFSPRGGGRRGERGGGGPVRRGAPPPGPRWRPPRPPGWGGGPPRGRPPRRSR